VAAHSLNPAVNIVRYLHADQSPPATEGVEVALYRGCIAKPRRKGLWVGVRAGQGSVRVWLGPRFPVNTFARVSERASGSAVVIYHFVIIDSLYAVALHFLSVCPVKRQPPGLIQWNH